MHTAVTGTNGGKRFATGLSHIFFLQRAGVRIGDAFDTTLDAGDVVFSMQVEVLATGNYYARAELWGEGPAGPAVIAVARDTWRALPAGAHRLTLRFGGAIVRDAGIDGPFRIRSVELYRTDTTPPHVAPPIREAASTPPYRSTELGDR
jgi:hypothetical protein